MCSAMPQGLANVRLSTQPAELAALSPRNGKEETSRELREHVNQLSAGMTELQQQMLAMRTDLQAIAAHLGAKQAPNGSSKEKAPGEASFQVVVPGAVPDPHVPKAGATAAIEPS